MGAIQGDRNTIGDIVYGSKGYLATGDEDLCAFQTWVGEKQEPGPRLQAAGDHYANFIDCVISRKNENLTSPIEEGRVGGTSFARFGIHPITRKS